MLCTLEKPGCCWLSPAGGPQKTMVRRTVGRTVFHRYLCAGRKPRRWRPAILINTLEKPGCCWLSPADGPQKTMVRRTGAAHGFSSLFICGTQAGQVAARNINTVEKTADRLKPVTQEGHRLKSVVQALADFPSCRKATRTAGISKSVHPHSESLMSLLDGRTTRVCPCSIMNLVP